MPVERMQSTLVENLLCLLAHDSDNGKVVSYGLDINLLEGEYRVLAERMIGYWREYGEPPHDHVADLVGDILDDPKNRRAKPLRRIISGLQQLSETVNARYVMDQMQTFSRLQRFRAAIVESAEKINADQHMALPDVENIFNKLLRDRVEAFTPGTRLTQIGRVLDRNNKLDDEFDTGIPELDNNGVVPQRGSLFMLYAAAGRGKTWGLIHLGKRALRRNKKVLHISLEMGEEQVVQRYYQSIFSVPKRAVKDGVVDVTTLHVDMGRLEQISMAPYRPEFHLKSNLVKADLNNAILRYGLKRFENLIVKSFPPRTLTANTLRAYLDTLETSEGFIPDLVLLDYVGIMKLDIKNHTLSIGDAVVDIRGVAIERDIAIAAAHQANAEGAKAKKVQTTHGSGAFAIVGHADTIITYTCTDLEFKYGLARVHVGKCRSEKDRYDVLITQAYGVGQWALESHMLEGKYDALFKQMVEEQGDVFDADDDEDAGNEGWQA